MRTCFTVKRLFYIFIEVKKNKSFRKGSLSRYVLYILYKALEFDALYADVQIEPSMLNIVYFMHYSRDIDFMT